MAPHTPRGVRLTVRGRVLTVAVLVLLLLAAFSLGRVSLSASTAQPARAPLPVTLVEPGDTLWSIARRVVPERDPRETVEQLRRLNDLGTETITVGQSLRLPR